MSYIKLTIQEFADLNGMGFYRAAKTVQAIDTGKMSGAGFVTKESGA